MRTQTEAVAIDRHQKTVRLHGLIDDKETELSYDKLVLATGALPIMPLLPGVDLPGVSVVANLSHARKIKDSITKGRVARAVVIGGGAIGIEAVGPDGDAVKSRVDSVAVLLPYKITTKDVSNPEVSYSPLCLSHGYRQ